MILLWRREQWNMARSKDLRTLDSRKFDWRQREKDWKLRRSKLSTSGLVGVKKMGARVKDPEKTVVMWLAVR
jgi:hypothetical protein